MKFAERYLMQQFSSKKKMENLNMNPQEMY